jgi:ABC-type nitrate/sulfonate/bicarbonate transport system permease component
MAGFRTAMRNPLRRSGAQRQAQRLPLSRRRSTAGLAPIFVTLASIGLWQIIYAARVATPGTLPSPVQVADQLGTLFGTSSYWQSILDTCMTWALGLAISALVAIPLGVLLGASRTAFGVSRATVDFVRTLPPVALVPVVALLYGATLTSALVLVVFATLWPLLLQTMYGIRSVDPIARDTARAYQLRGRDKLARVWLPSALPYVATGLRIASTMSLLLAVGAEFIAGSPGLGKSIALTEDALMTTAMYAYIFTAAALGVVLTALIVQLERRVLSWHPSQRRAI